MKKSKVQKMMVICLMGAMAVILQFIAIPFPLFTFLKVDFSDLPIMVAMFLFGPLAGILTAGLRSLIHLLLTGVEPSNLVGDVASFLASSMYILPIYYFFTRKVTLVKDRFSKFLGIISGTILMTAFMAVANYFVITPLYLKFFNVSADNFLGMSLAKYVTVGIVPFNLFKGALVSAAFLLVYAKLLPWLTRKTTTLSHQSFSK